MSSEREVVARILFDTALPDGDTLGTMLHSSDLVDASLPMKQQLEQTLSICASLADRIIAALEEWAKDKPELDRPAWFWKQYAANLEGQRDALQRKLDALTSDAAVEAACKATSIIPDLCTPSSTEIRHMRAAITAAIEAAK